MSEKTTTTTNNQDKDIETIFLLTEISSLISGHVFHNTKKKNFCSKRITFRNFTNVRLYYSVEPVNVNKLGIIFFLFSLWMKCAMNGFVHQVSIRGKKCMFVPIRWSSLIKPKMKSYCHSQICFVRSNKLYATIFFQILECSTKMMAEEYSSELQYKQKLWFLLF